MKYTIKDAEYYQALHDNDIGYQTNNWLVDELGEILKFNPTSILELACGNGKFLDIVIDILPRSKDRGFLVTAFDVPNGEC